MAPIGTELQQSIGLGMANKNKLNEAEKRIARKQQRYKGIN